MRQARRVRALPYGGMMELTREKALELVGGNRADHKNIARNWTNKQLIDGLKTLGIEDAEIVEES